MRITEIKSMAFVIKFVKGVRNHWKKSTFAAVALAYGVNYVHEYIETQDLMRIYCHKAAVYGQQPLVNGSLPRTITIILNPNANRRKALKNFEKYCSPILNLAGICVEVVQTESEGHAKTLMDTVNATDAVVVAGGDGTLSEVVTGLLRRTGENKNNLLPIGVLPLGRNNSIASSLFPGGDHLELVHSLADASMAIVEEVVRPVDVMRIEVVDDEDENLGKPVYAVSGIEWGAYRDAQVKKDSYWYFGSLRKYMTYIFNGYKSSLNWNCKATVKYSSPCEGCSNCYIESKAPSNKRWYHKFLSNKSDKSNISGVVNEKCRETHEASISTSDLMLLTSNTISGLIDSPPKLILEVGPDTVDYIDFVRQGWQSEHGQHRKVSNTIEARQIELRPSIISKQDKELWFSIDKEDYEVKPVLVTLLPKFIQMFCKKDEAKVIV